MKYVIHLFRELLNYIPKRRERKRLLTMIKNNKDGNIKEIEERILLIESLWMKDYHYLFKK